MGKVIAGINMTLDGFCDHTYGIADDESHQHYSELLSSAGTVLYGRITYQLMEYWPPIAKKPTGNQTWLTNTNSVYIPLSPGKAYRYLKI